MLIELISQLESMSFDEISDFIDYVEYYHGRKFQSAKMLEIFLSRIVRRRRGKYTGTFPGDFKNPKRFLSMETRSQVVAERLAAGLSKRDYETMITVAEALQRVKAPMKKQSQGNIQVKRIPYQRTRKERDEKTGILVPVLDENGRIIVDTFYGCYFYLRYWQVLGDDDRDKKRVKSIYIGGTASLAEKVSPDYEYPYRALADYWMDLLEDNGIERTRRQNGELIRYKVRPKDDDNPIAELESLIMECVDMTHEPPIIDHEKLIELQERLCY